MDYKIKRLSNYSEDSLLNELRRVAKELNKDTLTKKEFKQHAKTGTSVIERRFGSWANALEKAGLTSKYNRNITDEKLFAEIERVWSQLSRQPSMADMRYYAKFSPKPYITRFGSWIKALEAFAQLKDKDETERFKDLTKIGREVLNDRPQKVRKSKKVEYGEPIEFLGLRHAPLNEQGVVYLFGVLSKQLGFIIEAVRTDFPDCEGKRQIPGKKNRWEQVSIEFEYKSSHFLEHGHNPNECDVIVCWEHDWKGCQIEVIALKEIYEKIKNQNVR